MARERFFEERSDESRIKAELVDKYFRAWARVIRATVERTGGRIAYIDLFAGPGRYRDGAASVPLMVLRNAIDDDFLCRHLVTIFNDKDSNNTRTLEEQIRLIPDISSLDLRLRCTMRRLAIRFLSCSKKQASYRRSFSWTLGGTRGCRYAL